MNPLYRLINMNNMNKFDFIILPLMKIIQKKEGWIKSVNSKDCFFTGYYPLILFHLLLGIHLKDLLTPDERLLRLKYVRMVHHRQFFQN